MLANRKMLISLLDELKNPSGILHGNADIFLEALEEMLDHGNISSIERALWIDILDESSKSSYLKKLSSASARTRWAEAAFRILRYTNYTLLDMFRSRLALNPDKKLFIETEGSKEKILSYKDTDLLTKKIAASLNKLSENPVVLIYTENSSISACCDLACLFYGILNTPVNVYFKSQEINLIADQVKVNIAITDTEERYEELCKTNTGRANPFKVILTDSSIKTSDDVLSLQKLISSVSEQELDTIVAKLKKAPVNKVATVMYTSGSTGKPKGVCFSQYNLTSKRYARAAALPETGNNELLLAYLPLYHTFGRYLEMLGMIFWNGTYVFAGNSSAETLLKRFPEVSPSGFISVPVRWEQLYNICQEKIATTHNPLNQKMMIKTVVGENLRWGLSAAGYLPPKIFRFFHKFGIELCSGFGMTEGTGGLTMTPPGSYKDNSIGIPLPGTYTNLKPDGELQVSGHYIARYIEDVGPDVNVPYPESSNRNYWLSTGDIFRIDSEGHFEIIDRVKDIYKNTKGQTVAPQIVEKEFLGVAGIKRTFLVGDGRPYNVLFIVPDFDDPIVKQSADEFILRQYFRQIINTANRELAPYERVINFEILKRDFSEENNELTPKGSYNRKQIENNFRTEIENLYKSDLIVLQAGKIQVHIPRWFFRDLGILEEDIYYENSFLRNRQSGAILTFTETVDENHIQIGDLIYHIKDDVIQLGLFAHQPRLWVANPELINFAPCKEGWDNIVQFEYTRVHLPVDSFEKYSGFDTPQPSKFKDRQLLIINNFLTMTLFSEKEEAMKALRKIEELIAKADSRTTSVIRVRLESLATHPVDDIRFLAYKILLLDEPTMIYSRAFPSFLYSGLPFLSAESIKEIAFSKLEKQRLESLRQRLFIYRNELNYPISEIIRNQLENLFRLLVSFAYNHIEFYGSVRSELVSWMLLQSDEKLSKTAEHYVFELSAAFEEKLYDISHDYDFSFWNNRIKIESDIDETEIIAIRIILTDNIFLKESIMLAYDDDNFEINSISPAGIWVGRISNAYHLKRYRISLNTENGKHYDLELHIYEHNKEETSIHTALWHIAISGSSYDSTVLPQMGCFKPEISSGSQAYIGELTVWDKIRAYSSVRLPGGPKTNYIGWKNLYVKAITAFFIAWRNSGFKIVPGIISPTNVVVPDNDLYEKATILSLSGWKEYENPASLFRPVVENFFMKVSAQYPWSRNNISVSWIFDSVLEALGDSEGRKFLGTMFNDKDLKIITCTDNVAFLDKLKDYFNFIDENGYMPLALSNAIERYKSWFELNKSASNEAKEETIIELHKMYYLYRYGESVRFELYRKTFFAEREQNVTELFDRLIKGLSKNAGKPALELSELPLLQEKLTSPYDRAVFSRMVFPKYHVEKTPELRIVKTADENYVVIETKLADKNGNQYSFRPPLKPSEIGELYRLYYKDNFPHESSENDRHLIAVDDEDNVIGGISYKMSETYEAQIDGTVVITSLKGRGIGTSMINDYCKRMSSQGVKLIRTYFLLRDFYLSCGFQTDKRYGALVKFINED